MLALDETIAAIATAAGGAARGIVRLSGDETLAIVSRCFQPSEGGPALADVTNATAIEGMLVGKAALAADSREQELRLPATLFFWPTRRSYTRQPMAEVHTFGSPPLLNWALETLCAAGARLAQPGEFTLRAFLAGRIDLTQAEAVLGVINASSREQLDVALTQLAGGLAQPLQQLRSDLLNLLADLEAGLDFVDEDIRFIGPDELVARLAAAQVQLDALMRQLRQRGEASERPRVALVGLPNAGKSSLFNALSRSPEAIVSPHAGTTRDFLSATIDCVGHAIELVDTAGIDGADTRIDSSRDSTREIDAIAQRQATAQKRRADLRLVCVDAASMLESSTSIPMEQPALLVATKCDTLSREARAAVSVHRPDPQVVLTSSRTGLGLPELRAAIASVLSAQHTSAVAATAARAADSVRLAGQGIAQAQELATADGGEELVAADVRAALDHLGQVVGAIYTDDLLDRIFSRFCIGK